MRNDGKQWKTMENNKIHCKIYIKKELKIFTQVTEILF